MAGTPITTNIDSTVKLSVKSNEKATKLPSVAGKQITNDSTEKLSVKSDEKVTKISSMPRTQITKIDSAEKVSVKSDEKVTNQVLQVFNKFDTNSDGKISLSELGVILDMLGSKSSPDEVKKMMKEIDSDGNGYVDVKEFEAFYLASGGKDTTDEELRDAFDLYDMDKNGKICVDELLTVLKSLGEKCSVRDCRKMIGSVDIDGDGCVNFEEFKKMMAGN